MSPSGGAERAGGADGAVGGAAVGGDAAVATLPRTAGGPTIDARSYGARGDGVADDTRALQAGLAAASGGRFFLPAGRYRVDADYGQGGSLQPASDTEIVLDAGATLKAMSSATPFSAVFFLRAVDRVSIAGGAIVGDRAGHFNTEGEQGHLLNVVGCADITVSDIRLSGAWGDGMIVAYDDSSDRICERVDLRRVECHENRRQGLSIVVADRVTVVDCVFSGTSGVAPAAGADIEPDRPWSVSHVLFERCSFHNNSGSGLQITGLASPGGCRDIRIQSCQAYGNSRSGVALFESDGVEIDDLTAHDNGDFGFHAVTTKGLDLRSKALWANGRGDTYVDEATRLGAVK